MAELPNSGLIARTMKVIGRGTLMDFYAVLDEALDLIRTRGRVSFRALQEHFGLDADRLDAIRTELLYAHGDEIRDEAHGLVWMTGHLAERRQLTMFFCDLVGSTALASRFDPEDWRAIVGAYYDVCARVIARFDGHIAQYLGDGLLVYFGYPSAHEDDAQRAVRAGLGIIEAVRQLNVTLAERHDVALSVRIGCHTGLVVVGEEVPGTGQDDMVLGDTPNIAARLESIAEPNTLVIGAPTHQLLGGLFEYESLGTPSLKGVSVSLEVYRVLHESAARTRLEAQADAGLTPLVGRSTELAVLEQRWAQAFDGHGSAVLIAGEAGIGKSRLVHALIDHAANQQVWLTPCQGSQYHRDTAFYPFVDLFQRVVLRFERPESPADRLRKLERFFEDSGQPLAETLPHLCSMLSIPPAPGYSFPDLPPEQQKQETMRALQTILLRRSIQQPVLFIVEDLHWVDPTTLEFIQLLVTAISGARILAVFTCRPEFASPWAGSSAVTQIDLARLPANEAAELINRVAGDKPLPDEIVADIVTRTDGVPLFIEELTKTLLESDLLEEGPARYELAGPLPPLAIPNTLHDSLMARLDRLSTIKALAQLGAAIGREFSYALLHAVSPWRETLLQDGLEQLVAAEFLYQEGTPPVASYRFKHALIQDAAYQSLLKSTRQQHHKRIANVLESQFPETIETQPELLARHYTEAGLAERAIPYWHAASQHAMQRFATLEASNHAGRGLELLARQADSPHRAKQELSLQLVLAPAFSTIRGPQSVEHIYARALELAREVGDPADLFPALAGLTYAQIVLGRMRNARKLAEEFLALTSHQDDALVAAAGHSMVAYAAWWEGDIPSVREHSRRCLALCDPSAPAATLAYNQNPWVICGYLDALAAFVAGYPAQARRAMTTALDYAAGLRHPYSLSISLLFAAQLGQLMRDPAEARARAEESLALSAEHGLHAVWLWCLLPRGWAAVQEGDPVAGIADIREAMDRRRAFGINAVWPWFLTVLAEAQGGLGQVDDALASLDEAQHWVQHNGESLYAAEMHRVRGELLLDAAAAERCLLTAIDVARTQQAKLWELRAATSLCRMWLQQNRFDEARGLLSPIYNWFTEGFDTADLQDAKALLETLS
jgi:class 3 adenylate cyclase/predicted ATPase